MLALFLVVLVFFYSVWHVARRSLNAPSSLGMLPGPPRKSLLTGNLSELFNLDGWQFHREISEKYGGVIKVHGFLGAKQVYVSDPKALHHILVKDQHIYEEPTWFLLANSISMGKGLVASIGDAHKRQRKMLSPLFSNNHMRNMAPVFYSVAHKLRDGVAAQVTHEVAKVDILSWLSRAALEFVGQAGLGYSFDSLNPDEETSNEYARAARNMSPIFAQLVLALQFLPFIIKLAPPAVLRGIADLIPWATLQQYLKVLDTMRGTALEVFESKKVMLSQEDNHFLEQSGGGNNIISLLMRANMAASPEDRLPEDEMLGQVNTLIFAAFDTSSSALARVLHTLAFHPEVQDRLRKEVIEARQFHGDLDYDELVNLPYLDAVCRETLRLYPPVSVLWRIVRKDIILPLATPIKATDGKTVLKEIFLKKGTEVFLGLMAANRDKSIWGLDADEWKPERWLSPPPSSVTDARMPGVYSHMMTFLGGSRSCVGFKFAELEIKILLSLLLESFIFAPADETMWLMTGVASPTSKARWEKTKVPYPPSLPMNVTLVTESKVDA